MVQKPEQLRGIYREAAAAVDQVDASLDDPVSSLKVEEMGRKEAILKLRQVLLHRRDALRRALAGDINSLNELRAQSSGDVLDAALDSAQDEISSQLAEVESRELAQIETALERMRAGTYGICEMTGKPIPLARLQALPYATMCIEAQREMEKKGGSSASTANWGRLIDSSNGPNDVVFNDIELDVS